MEIKQFAWDVVDANSWLMTENNHGLLIDAVDNPELYEALRPLESLTVILTHCHFDHIYGLNHIREIKPDSTVLSTRLCSEYIGNKYRNMSSSADAFLSFYQQGMKRATHIEPIICLPAESVFEENTELEWQGHKLCLIAVHGHSDDGLVVLLDNRFLFSGDSLLSIPTVTRLPRGNSKRFQEEDIPRFKRMSAEAVYPGHGEKGQLKEMLRINQQ